MSVFNMVVSMNENTVVSEYISEGKRSASYQSEADLEKEFIRMLTEQGCEKYMSMLRYGQYGQVGADGIWRNKEQADKKAAIRRHLKRHKCNMIRFLHSWKKEKSMEFGISANYWD